MKVSKVSKVSKPSFDTSGLTVSLPKGETETETYTGRQAEVSKPLTDQTTMTHTFKHQFANGIRATATFRDDPPAFDVEWHGKPTLAIVPEYQRWRRTVLEDVARLTGKRIAVVELT